MGLLKDLGFKKRNGALVAPDSMTIGGKDIAGIRGEMNPPVLVEDTDSIITLTTFPQTITQQAGQDKWVQYQVTANNLTGNLSVNGVTQTVLTTPVINKADFFGDTTNVATYLFDGNINDARGTYNGTATGVTYTTSALGQAAVFSTHNAYALTPAFNISNLTFSFWFKCTSINGISDHIIGEAPNSINCRFTIGVTATSVYITFGGDPASNVKSLSYNGITPNDGKWHHIVFGATSLNSAYLYVDNIFAGTLNGFINAPGSSPFYFAHRSGYTDTWKGQLDNVRIFNRALTASEVTNLYNEGLTTFVPKLGSTNSLNITTTGTASAVNVKTWKLQ